MRPRNVRGLDLDDRDAVLVQPSEEAMAKQAPKAGPSQTVFMPAADLNRKENRRCRSTSS